MKKIEIKAYDRKEIGRNRIKKLRREDNVPAVMYGDKPLTLTVSGIDALKLYRARHENFIIKLTLNDKVEKEALLKDIQLDKVKNNVIHMDFLELIEGKTITTKIPVELEGTPEGIKLGGIVEHFMWDIHIECLPKDIPERITTVISEMQIGDSLHISDLEIGENIRVLDKPEQVILTIGLPTGMAEEVEAEGVEGEEGEGAAVEGEAAEGEGKAEGEKAEEGKKPADGKRSAEGKEPADKKK
ncbi:MAG: 50S ribosomal protein L25 [Spirochaetes bacterium]|nr:50S ribosomal protein L25 [Spirochaetota bacterium]